MKIYLMTDLEGVAGVLDEKDWLSPGDMYYEKGRQLLTMEANAAIEGFFESGADEVVVADGHGAGAIDSLLLDPRAIYLRGFPDPWPFMLDKTYDAIAWVGQHAKSNTPYAHLAHTGSFSTMDVNINGISVGEFGQLALCAAELGVPPVFCSGDTAMRAEAEALVKGIITVSVKTGLKPGTGEECTAEEYAFRNRAAMHLHLFKARELIRGGAKKAMLSFIENKGAFSITLPKPPYEMISRSRKSAAGPGRTAVYRHPSSIISMLNSKAESLVE